MSAFLNKKPLLEEEQQQQIAKVYFTAFLETTMKDKRGYIPVFRDYRYAKQWLPEDIYINRYEDNSFVPVCTFDEDVDVTTGSKCGVTIETEYLDLWKEYDLSFRKWSTKRNNALTVGWKRDTTEISDSLDQELCMDTIAKYRITLPDSLIKAYSIDSNSFFVFSAANTKERVPEDDDTESEDSVSNINNNNIENNGNKKEVKKDEEEKEDEDSDEEEKPVQVGFTILMSDSEGNETKLPLSEFAYIPPVLKSKFLKWESQNKRYGSDYEVTLQDFRLPLKTFIKQNPDFKPEKLSRIEFVFDQMPEGVVVIDRIGFAR